MNWSSWDFVKESRFGLEFASGCFPLEQLGSDLPKQPVVLVGRGPVTISNLDRDLSMPLKSLSRHQPSRWNDPYRSRKRTSGLSGKSLQLQIIALRSAVTIIHPLG